MNAFRFLHAADLHLGSPFVGLARANAEVAAVFANASRAAFSDLVDRAIEASVAFAVIAGDVYDGEWKDASIGLFFNRELGRLDRAGIPVFLLKGNHDADSVVTRSISLPGGVRQFPSRKPETFRLDDLRVALHGQSFAERSASDNLALSYPPAVAGWFNIGVLHTCCEGQSAHARYAPCSIEDLRLRGYDYWALGHVHEHSVVSRDPWIVFPGNLQGRSVRECGPRGAVIVDVADGHVTNVERVFVDRARWAQATVDLSGVDNESAAFHLIEEAVRPIAHEAEARVVALRLTLAGDTPLHAAFAAAPRRIAEEAQAAAQRVGADIWLEKLKLATTPPLRVATGGLELKSFDLAALFDDLAADPEIHLRAKALAETIANRIPASAAVEDRALADDVAALIAEARALALGRLGV
ncbi:MAG TPA: DNA repair exonuclease [Hansschlegelia sp.]